ncbi:IS66 family insertion sequence element accessory protein TnpA, partial [Algoriphagus confluentis]
LPTFSYWYRKVGAGATAVSSGFTEVSPSLPSGDLEVVYPNGVRIRGIQDLSLLELLVKL